MIGHLFLFINFFLFNDLLGQLMTKTKAGASANGVVRALGARHWWVHDSPAWAQVNRVTPQNRAVCGNPA
jgi:hypothetical protein